MVLFGIFDQPIGGELVFRDQSPLGLPGRAWRLALSLLERNESALESALEGEVNLHRPGAFHRRITDWFMDGKLDGEGETMNRFFIALFVSFVLIVPTVASAHIGSPTVFFQGQAGPYNTQVIIRPAEVIPGLAEVSVRVESGGAERVTALPMKWNAGPKGAPPPDLARLIRGETNLYSAQLWFMEAGAHTIQIEITGTAGRGR